jgi:putative FmdB family regulatory protein
MFEYECRACGHVFEELVFGQEDEAELRCPACGADKPDRRLSACAVRVGGGVASAPPMGPTGGCGGGGGFT